MATQTNLQQDMVNNKTTADQLLQYIQRIERLSQERKSLGVDITDIFTEAKGSGFDVKAMKAVIKLRAMEPAEIEEQENLLDTYKVALGMV